jgi:hypothetical protein
MASQNVTVKGDSGPVVLGIVAVVALGGMFALVIAALAMIILIGTGITTAVLGYKVYQLHVYRTVALASIAAGMNPPPLHAERTTPTPRELLMGRREVA